MALTKEQKNKVEERLKKIIENYPTVVFVNFHGLDVPSTNKMRRNFGEKEIGYYVAKKTLTKRVFEKSNISGEVSSLDGELALAYGEDLIAPAREIKAMMKKTSGAISILGGIFEGNFVGKDKMEEIALIPPLKVLYSQFVGVINSPIKKFVSSIDQIAKTKVE